MAGSVGGVKGAGCGGRVSVVRQGEKLTTDPGRSVRRLLHGIIGIRGRQEHTIMGLLPREGKFLDPMADVVNVTAPAVTRSSR